jgi:hypothetical protein
MTTTVPNTLVAMRELIAKAVREHDTELLRICVTVGASFAKFTVLCQTPLAEKTYDQWIDAGAPDNPATVGIPYLHGTRSQTIADLRALTDDDLWTLVNLPSREREQFFAGKVRGIGNAKSCFALACAGIGTNACLDSRFWNRFGENFDPATVKKARGSSKAMWDAYWTIVDAHYDNATDSAWLQWVEWLDELAASTGYKTEHELIVRAVYKLLSA